MINVKIVKMLIEFLLQNKRALCWELSKLKKYWSGNLDSLYVNEWFLFTFKAGTSRIARFQEIGNADFLKQVQVTDGTFLND